MLNFVRLLFIAFLISMIFIVFEVGKAWPNTFVPDTPERVESLVMAIYKAEGGKGTRYPFGIKSVSCRGYEGCKRVCENTVRNNIKRWKKSVAEGDKRDYLTFLWHRYCPPNLHASNAHWKKNVLYFLGEK